MAAPAAPAPGKPATGAVEGRIFDASRRLYVERARVVIDGTSLETFTDATGQYRLGQVPPGPARLKVFFTGAQLKSELVTVGAGETVQCDVTIESALKSDLPGGSIMLDEVVVTASKAMSGAAIAINEQRFARNMKTVIASDEFGVVVDGTPGEILKYLPGVAMDYTAGDARGIALGGVQAVYTSVTMGGFDYASSSAGTTQRTVQMDNVGINNLSRIELNDSPTPESPANALAGSVNLVPRSAFELSKPTFTGTVFLAMKDDHRDFHRTAGPFFEPTRKVMPGFNFSATVPVSKRWGFSISGNHSRQFAPENSSVSTWNGVSVATNGTTLPDTTPDNPYLSAYAYTNGARLQQNDSLGFTFDYRFSNIDVLSLSFQKAYLNTKFRVQWQRWNLGAVNAGGWGPTFTHGRTNSGSIVQDNQNQDIHLKTTTPTITFRHNGSFWKGEAGLAHSSSAIRSRSGDKGYFYSTSIRRVAPVTIDFDETFYLRPGVITVRDGVSGNAVDPSDFSNYTLNTAGDMAFDRVNTKTSAFLGLGRLFDVRGVPVTIKIGLDVRRDVRDGNQDTITYTHVGRDGVANTTDDRALPFLDEDYSRQMPPYGFPRNNWISAVKLYDAYRANPAYFVANDAARNTAYRNTVAQSKYAREIVSATYLRTDAAFLQNRLRFTAGARAEQTNILAQGPLSDPTRNYLRDAGGQPVDANPALPGFQPSYLIPTSNALAVSQATYLQRQQVVRKEYLRLFPSINASYNLTDNLIFRSAYYESIGRPDFNQYAGGVTLPDLNSTSAITLGNASIKPWTASTVRARFEYYFSRVGQVSVSGFRREFENFFATQAFPITPELLDLYGLDPALWGDRNVSASRNLPESSVTTGLQFDYKQALTFLPQWARGVQVGATATALRNGSANSHYFAGLVPRVYNWSISLNRPKFRLNANWNYRGKTRVGLFSVARGIAPATFNFYPKRLIIDLLGEYRLSRHFSLTASIRNLDNAFTDFGAYNPATPAYARLRQRTDYSASWSLGLKGTF